MDGQSGEVYFPPADVMALTADHLRYAIDGVPGGG
jgi:hypothetical protein